MINFRLILFASFFVSTTLIAQIADSSKMQFSWDGYIETYHTLVDPVLTNNNTISDLLYNHSRIREVNINLALLRANFSNEYIRGDAAIMTGTYARYNLSHEPTAFQYIYQLHAGVKLTKQHQLWLEAGVFESCIGHENPFGMDQLTLSRSLAAENTPYYLSGARIQYESNNKKWLAALYYLNGWQQMFNNFNRYKPALGAQIQYRINDEWLFNYTNYTGTVADGVVENFRLFHDFYAIWKPTKRIEVRGLLDIGNDYISSNRVQRWVAINAIARYEFAKHWYAATRVEYYKHPDGLFIQAGLPIRQFRNVSGASITLDRQLYKNVLIRNEARMLHISPQPDIFQTNGSNIQWMHYVALCVRL